MAGRHGRAPMRAGHVGRGPRLVEEHEAGRVEVGLARKPRLARRLHVRAVLLGGMGCLFLYVSSRASRKLHSVPSPTVRPCSASSRARISSRGMSTLASISARRNASCGSSYERRARPCGRDATVPVVVSAAIQRIEVAMLTPKRAAACRREVAAAASTTRSRRSSL